MENKKVMPFLVLWFFMFFYPISLFGWGGENHCIITRQVTAFIPKWELEILGTYVDSLANQYCLIPDMYRSPDYKEIYAPYIEIPYLPASTLYHKSEDPMADVYIFAYFTGKAIEMLGRNEIREASRYIGTLTHFIEDNSCPVHVVDNPLLVKLLPPPETIVDFGVHGALEGPLMTMDMVPYAPAKLGARTWDAVYPFMEKFLAMQENGRAQAVPIIQAIYKNDGIGTNRGKVRAAEPAARLVADMIHTIFCIAYGR